MSPSDSSRGSRVQIDDQLKQFNLGQFRSMGLLHMVGYGILLLILVDVITIIFPVRLQIPTWEFQVIGQLVERIPVLFLGLVLVFLGEGNPRGRYEGVVLKLLSWLTLVLAIVYFLMVPIGILNTIRIDQENAQKANLEFSQRISQIQVAQSQIDRAQSPEELGVLVTFLRNSGTATNLSSEDLPQMKQQLTQILKNREQFFLADRDFDVSKKYRTLLKQSLKWNLGAFIAGTLLFLMWLNTAWAR